MKTDPIKENRLLNKVKPIISLIGKEALTQVFILYYTMKAPNTPAWCKSVIIGALGYFLALFDSIPDLTPLLGYTDDIAVMTAAIATLGLHVTPEIKQKAESRINDLMAKNSQPKAS